jgi:hypothetical protein
MKLIAVRLWMVQRPCNLDICFRPDERAAGFSLVSSPRMIHPNCRTQRGSTVEAVQSGPVSCILLRAGIPQPPSVRFSLACGHFDRSKLPLNSGTGYCARSERLDLVAFHAFAAGTICHLLMEIPARMTNPNRWNSERETVLTIAEISTFIGFFRHTSSAARSTVLTRLTDSLDASIEEPLMPVCWKRLPIHFRFRIRTRDTQNEDMRSGFDRVTESPEKNQLSSPKGAGFRDVGCLRANRPGNWDRIQREQVTRFATGIARPFASPRQTPDARKPKL